MPKDFSIGFHEHFVAFDFDPDVTANVPGWDIIMLPVK
jgi:hypothetical protein